MCLKSGIYFLITLIISCFEDLGLIKISLKSFSTCLNDNSTFKGFIKPNVLCLFLS